MMNVHSFLRDIPCRFALLAMCTMLFVPLQPAKSHCDTMDGPVVASARDALARKDVSLALRWVRARDEAEVRGAFGIATAVRERGEDARRLADQYFFEILVRVHRIGEGAPYMGLKPSGAPLDPGILEAEKAISSGSADELVDQVAERVSAAVRTRFDRMMNLRREADKSVENGREFVAAYVNYMHLVESLYAATGSAAVSHDERHRLQEAHQP